MEKLSTIGKTLLTSEELGKIQEMNNEFTKAKMAIGDIELQKQNIFKAIDAMQLNFGIFEKEMIEKYGQDSVINIQTGEVTKKEEAK